MVLISLSYLGSLRAPGPLKQLFESTFFKVAWPFHPMMSLMMLSWRWPKTWSREGFQEGQQYSWPPSQTYTKNVQIYNNDERWVLTVICLAQLWIVQHIRRRTILQKRPPQFQRSTPLLEKFSSVSGEGSYKKLNWNSEQDLTKAYNHVINRPGVAVAVL